MEMGLYLLTFSTYTATDYSGNLFTIFHPLNILTPELLAMVFLLARQSLLSVLKKHSKIFFVFRIITFPGSAKCLIL